MRVLTQLFILTLLVLTAGTAAAQVNTVEFGKNRVQYQKFRWEYNQSENFNVYFTEDALGLGRYVSQVAEKELPSIEAFVEYALQRRINIVVYNHYDAMQQSNIGIGIDWQNTGGLTKLVNNKMVVYYNGNREHLRIQIRQGIARNLVENLLFGDNLGEFAANQALLDLPKWLTDGYVAYAAENWNPDLDDQLRGILLASSYKTFYHFAFDKPMLAGHAFWKYVADRYGKARPTYFLYLARIYRNLNQASYKIAKKKFKDLLKDFMNESTETYYKDIRGRRNTPKGQLAVSEYYGKTDYIRFNANPVPRSFTYGVVEFRQGRYQVVLMENFVQRRVLLKLGVRSREDDQNPHYPILAWDPKGTRLGVLYWEEGKIKFFIYDVARRVKINKQEIKGFDQIQDMKFMLNENNLIFSAVRKGQSDIYTYKLDKQTYEQITNDPFDDLDPSFVAFPNKTGILYSSNRPHPDVRATMDSLPAPHFNIYLVDNWNKSVDRQLSKLTDLKWGNARFPSQYNMSHFTFISDENGVNNRYAGFFTTERAGIDTLVFIGEEVLRNPPQKEVDSLLREYKKEDVDSIGFVSLTNDSAYVFPLTNYQSSMLETRTAGDNQQVSEVVRLGDVKLLYRLRVDENTLRRRNISTPPTQYRRKTIEEAKKATKKTLPNVPVLQDTTTKNTGEFTSGFEEEGDSGLNVGTKIASKPIESLKLKRYSYRPPKFFNDYLVSGFNNNVLVTRYQPFQGGYGPVQLSNNDPLNGIVRVGTSDLMEDWKIAGGYRISPNLSNNEYVFSSQYLKKRVDFGVTYYRNSINNPPLYTDSTWYNTKLLTNLYQATISYPFSKVRSLRFNLAYRSDRYVKLANEFFPDRSLFAPDDRLSYALARVEFVHDDAISPALNIWEGLRWKIYFDYNAQIGKNTVQGKGDFPFVMNAGFDLRHYLPIYRNISWSVRAAADFSFGTQKIIYYLGGVDNWLMFANNQKADGTYRYFDPAHPLDPDNDYAYQSLAVNLRGFKQNIANGNNAVVLNSEVRIPVFTSFINKPINNALLRNFQLVQFIDLGTAWNGAYDKIERPALYYRAPPVTVKVKAGGIGPFAGGYGFGARSTLLGYFLRVDAAWQMDGVFKGRPKWYLAMGLDF